VSFIHTIIKNFDHNPSKLYLSEIHGASLSCATGAELTERIQRVQVSLRERKITPGDRVVLIGPNRVNWVAIDLALLAFGAIVVPMYDRQDPKELAIMLADCEPSLVLCFDEELEAAIKKVYAPAQTLTWEQALSPEPGPFTLVDRAADDAVTIIYTSGTSGDPKGVVLSRRNVDYMLPITRDALQNMMGSRETDDRVFHYLPFCFAGSRIVLWTCLFKNNALMMSTDLTNLMQELQVAKPNYFLNVPVLLERMKNGVEAKLRERGAAVQRLYEASKRAYAAKVEGRTRLIDRLTLRLANQLLFRPIGNKIGEDLDCLICGSAPLGEDTQRWFEMIGIRVYQVYGLTETTAIVTMDQPPQVIPGRVGPAINGCTIKLGDHDELLVKSDGVFQKYWNKPEATESAFIDGWFHTGDQAEVDDNGNWRIIGRVKNLIVPSSGHNVAPEPLEQQLIETIEGVEQAVVVGHGRPYLGAIITGKVDEKVLKFGIDEMNTNLPHYKRIREYVVADEPFTIENGLLTANQKLRRQAIENHFSPVVDQMYS
jgi:long-chain acyl-CoA synthetase